MWPFHRKRKPVHVGPTTVDWRPGDVAECVVYKEEWNGRSGPDIGERLLVSDVFYGVSKSGADKGFALRLIGWGREGWSAMNFRKVTLTDTGADRKVTLPAPEHEGVTA